MISRGRCDKTLDLFFHVLSSPTLLSLPSCPSTYLPNALNPQNWCISWSAGLGYIYIYIHIYVVPGSRLWESGRAVGVLWQRLRRLFTSRLWLCGPEHTQWAQCKAAILWDRNNIRSPDRMAAQRSRRHQMSLMHRGTVVSLSIKQTSIQTTRKGQCHRQDVQSPPSALGTFNNCCPTMLGGQLSR